MSWLSSPRLPTCTLTYLFFVFLRIANDILETEYVLAAIVLKLINHLLALLKMLKFYKQILFLFGHVSRELKQATFLSTRTAAGSKLCRYRWRMMASAVLV